MAQELDDEASRATELLAGKSVSRIWRHRSKEVGIEFTDGARLFVDATTTGIELSISGTDGADTDTTSDATQPDVPGSTQ